MCQMCDKIIYDDPFSLRFVPAQYKSQQICDKAVDDCVAALKFVPDWFVTSKTIKILLLICTQTKIYSTLMKILVMLYSFVMEWIFLT